MSDATHTAATDGSTDPSTEDLPEGVPVAFLSYAWTDSSYRQRVMAFADRLADDGVHVVADFLDVQPGDDLDHFMERMVNDPRVTKVVLICNPPYRDKADAREGGAGTEAQIVSRAVYEQPPEDERRRKFVAVLFDREEDGSAPTPTYYGSRRYVDLTDPETAEDEYVELLHFLRGTAPRTRRPLGTPPADVVAAGEVTLGTSTRQRRAVRALREGDRSAAARLTDYLDTFAENLDRFRIAPEDHPDQMTHQAWGRIVLERSALLLPYRDEAVEVFEAVALAGAGDEEVGALRRFFERVAALFEAVSRDVPRGGRMVFEHEADPFRLLWQELFLYAVAALLARERYGAVGRLTGERYLIEQRGRRSAVPFTVLQEGSGVLEAAYTNPNGSKPYSSTGKFLVDRATLDRLDREALMEADALLYVNGQVRKKAAARSDVGYQWTHWYASTWPYMERVYDPFPVFLRAEHELDRVLPAFGTNDPASLREVFAEISADSQSRSARPLVGAVNAKVLAGG